MHQDQSASQSYQKIQISGRNKTRLILQNKKLLQQIQKLQNIISIMIQKDVTNNIQVQESKQQIKAKYHSQFQQQNKIIARLKKQIKNIKSGLTNNNQIQDVKRQENQIIYLLKELDKLTQQRNTMLLKKNQKKQALEYYKPMNNQTAQTFQRYKKTKSTNRQLNLKIYQLQRQIIKYHKYKQLGRSTVPKEYDNPDYQLMNIDNQIRGMKKQMKKIEQKWKYKVESLDREYFSFKTILVDKNQSYQNVEKQMKGCQNRMAGLRDIIQVNLDRERINGLVISPTKRKEMQEIIEEEKKKYKRLQIKNQQKKTKSPQKTKKSIKQAFPKIIQQTNEQNKSQKLQPQTQKPIITHYSQKKKQQNDKKASQIIIKPTKIMQSIGVGTTFYYNDD